MLLSYKEVQWNLLKMVTDWPEVDGCNREVAALRHVQCMEFDHIELKLNGCIEEVAA